MGRLFQITRRHCARKLNSAGGNLPHGSRVCGSDQDRSSGARCLPRSSRSGEKPSRLPCKAGSASPGIASQATVERATTLAYDRFQRWFGSAQDRAEQWFQTHVRVVTIICSICAAFVLQLDTAEIFRQLRAEPKLVEALVKAAPGVVQKVGDVAEPSPTPASNAQQDSKKVFTDLQKDLEDAGFDIVPRPFFGRWSKDPTPTWAGAAHVPRPMALVMVHLVGILATAGLLALGAPFWFNLLKNLMSLRPALATLIEKRPTSAPALPPAPATPPSPS